MDSVRVGKLSRVLLHAILMVSWSSVSFGQEFNTFYSAQYGFTIKYPKSWVKMERPQSDQHVVFEAPAMTGNFRSRVHVAVHTPVTNLGIFLQELRDGIGKLQKKSEESGSSHEVQILDEGEFKCDVPGAYYYFVKTYDHSMKIWMNIVIVFYQHDKTVVRISCFTPSEAMENFHGIFNEILASVAFTSQRGAAAESMAPPSQNQARPKPVRRPEVEITQIRPEDSSPAQPPRRVPRGPLREPMKPAQGAAQ